MPNPTQREQGTVAYGRVYVGPNSLSNVKAVEFGAVTTIDADGVCVGATATGAATLSATGALVSGGVATFDVPRAVGITSTGNESGITMTFTGTDEYGVAVVEDVTGPNNTTVYGAKAFKTVTSVAVDGATTSVNGVNVGNSKTLGLPGRIGDKGKVISVSVDGIPESTLTVVAGFTTTGTSTATTADVRGTVAPNTAPNGTKAITAFVVYPDSLNNTGFKGIAQYGG